MGNRPVVIYGMGKTGKSVLKALHKAGASLIVGDDNPKKLENITLENIAGQNAQRIDILNIEKQDFSKAAFLVLSPGIALDYPSPHKIVQKANRAGLEIISDIELFSRIYPYIKTIGLTGTNGKSTSVSLISHILTQAGVKNALGGNIGTPVFDLDISDKKWLVLEMSSYQIDLCPSFRPDIAAILNITPDHIDRHGSMENYVAAKARLFEGSGVAVICTDDEYTKAISENLENTGNSRELVEVNCANSSHIDNCGISNNNINRQNAACAYAILRKTGLSEDEIINSMASFPGLAHRQYLLRTINKVEYINDSKATNSASTASALGRWDNIYWIAGGRKKQTGLEGLEKFKSRIKHVFLIGESAIEFASWCERHDIDFLICNKMDKAVDKAHIMAQNSDVGGAVLLSPACASFDQYESFEKRAEHFTRLVEAL